MAPGTHFHSPIERQQVHPRPRAMAPPPLPRRGISLTLVAALLAVGIERWPALSDFLIFDRAAILHGQLWRLWTGALVHFGIGHLIWNLILFAMAGRAVERRDPRAARLLMLGLPPAIGLCLLVLQPHTTIHAGLMDVTTGLLMFLALHGLARPRWLSRTLGATLLVVLCLKTGLELIRTAPLLGLLTRLDILGSPLTHLLAVAAAVFVRMRLGHRSLRPLDTR